MNLFTKPINTIKFEDVENFCKEGIPEGMKVEYKAEFPSNEKLAKEISSFANTQGGIILIGVEEKDGTPILPIEGINYFEGIHEKITSICLKNIEPPVFPEIQVCRKSENPNKAVVLIRVQESDETPHRIEYGTKIYIRVARQSEPILAPFEEIEWLINRRKKAIENKKRLLQRAEQRFKEQPFYKSFSAFKKTYLIPLFPSKMLLDIESLDEVIREIRVDLPFITFLNYDKKTANESVIFEIVKTELNETYACHAEINQYGLIWCKQSFWENNEKSKKDKVDLFSVLEQLLTVSLFSLKFYEKVGYWGALEMNLSLEGMKNRILSWAYDIIERTSFDNYIEITRKTSVIDLKENLDAILLDFYKNFLWSCNAPDIARNQDTLQSHLTNVKINLD